MPHACGDAHSSFVTSEHLLLFGVACASFSSASRHVAALVAHSPQFRASACASLMRPTAPAYPPHRSHASSPYRTPRPPRRSSRPAQQPILAARRRTKPQWGVAP
eukprot:CAMPEP_0115862380 /NCGR_PEP_ID=MMETSP0287-20121206/18143_1 /TAXON_ID=412157 /ORGANISM="Chrysochromulina rotalis, Strain UIO044" /LENGTH=104 /DNA_ID=CAMNT_0003316793 /DNA_START=89 /DNA_END=403 /DNA_ORIENTATION=+